MKPIPSIMLAGILPFVAISVELSAILSSLWSGRIYYMFGFLFLCYGLMIIMCAAVTVLMVYFLLCGENYHWQWRSFLCAGATGVYVLLYSLLHWVRYLALSSFTGTVLYMGYSLLIAALVFVMTGKSLRVFFGMPLIDIGTIGFLAAWMFTLKIYASIKVD
jgi:transmembrane 9 superfamily member 2/4